MLKSRFNRIKKEQYTLGGTVIALGNYIAVTKEYRTSFYLVESNVTNKIGFIGKHLLDQDLVELKSEINYALIKRTLIFLTEAYA
jgi:hypothetical protein